MSKRLSITIHREKGTNEHLKFEKRKNVYSNVYITLFVYCLHTINSEHSMIEIFFSLVLSKRKGMKITFNGADVKSICTFIYSSIKHFFLGIHNSQSNLSSVPELIKFLIIKICLINHWIVNIDKEISQTVQLFDKILQAWRINKNCKKVWKNSFNENCTIYDF